MNAEKKKGLPLDKPFSTNKMAWLRGLDLNQRPPGYEPRRSTLSLVGGAALSLRPRYFYPSDTLVLDASWTQFWPGWSAEV
jgi:hypothetical protein